MTWADHGKRPGPVPKKTKGKQQCAFEDEEGRCERNNFAQGLCSAHYMQRKRGVPLRRIRPPRPTVEDGLLWCGRCKMFRDPDEFGRDPTRNQPKRTCRPCASESQKAYVDRNHDAVNLNRRLRKRSLTSVEHEELLARQEGACGVCRRTDRPLDIDHSHDTGAVRGLLCGPCNRALGFLGDDVNLLTAAIQYLEAP